MRAFGFTEHGGVEDLEFLDLVEPVAGPGEVKVRIRAAGFNRLDRFVIAGIPGVPIVVPHAIGSDGAGEVAAVGAGVTRAVVGDRVVLNPGLWDGTCEECLKHEESRCRQFRILGEHTQGSAAEYVVLPERNVHPLPTRLTFEQAAAAPLVFQTAWRALRTVGALASGETVAIIGAGGGTNTAAVQIARLTGARVVVTTRSPEKAERVRASEGVDAIVVNAEQPIDKALWEWSGKRGVDLIFDSVGRPSIPFTTRALARGGRLVVIGATGGPLAEIDLRTLFWRQASLRGSTMASAAEFDAMLAALDRGDLTPVVDRVFDFHDAEAAFRRFESPDLFGKVVLKGPP